jgi:hypothetical protein
MRRFRLLILRLDQYRTETKQMMVVSIPEITPTAIGYKNLSIGIL